MKRLLRNKANYKVLEGFMSELLNEEITIINISESESNQETEDDKFNRVDLLVENSKKELTIIEIQQLNEYDYFHRILYGTSKLISEYLKLGEPYSNIRKVYSVNILYFDLGQGEDYIYHGKTDFEGIHKHDKLILSETQTEKFHKYKPEQIFPEYYIIKVNRFDDNAKSALDEWIYYLKNDEIKDDFRAKGLLEAKEILKIENLNEEDRRAYKRYWENKSYEASIVDTIKFDQEYKLKKEARITIAKNCISAGVELDVIIKSIGLSKEEIEKLK
ncbi:MAG: Rpn family recombination-promoting nuclease/putative transposase [Bacteroidota bacterium]